MVQSVKLLNSFRFWHVLNRNHWHTLTDIGGLNRTEIANYEGISNIADTAPIFPLGEGGDCALRSLANYPVGTKLFEIETIGAIMTFLSNSEPNSKGSKDVWNKKLLHTAVFVEDLIELHNNGLIEGVTPITEFKYKLNEFTRMKQSGFQENENGDLEIYFDLPDVGMQKRIHPKPVLKDYVSTYLCYEWDEHLRDELIAKYESGDKTLIEINDSIIITKKGYARLSEIARNYKINDDLNNLVKPLIDINYFDTAVREIAVSMESRLKRFHEVTKFGEKLIEYHIAECIKANDNQFNAGLKAYKQELKTMNRFVRNEFMHNKFSITSDNMRFILMRQNDIMNMMTMAFERLKTDYSRTKVKKSQQTQL